MDTKMVARRKLWDIAVDQHGYFTTRQAHEVGVSNAALASLTQRDRLDHLAYGVYRIPEFPASQYDLYTQAVLWTGVGEAFLSHETALDTYDVCDILPDKVHVTVPLDQRIRRGGGAGYVIHREAAPADQVGWWQGIPTARLPLAIEQCIRYGTANYLIRQALDKGAARGMILPRQVEQLERMLDAHGSGKAGDY